jgi:hypothetical protein
MSDPVNHPDHYNSSAYEAIDVITAWGLGFCLGNTVKYISRAGKKDPAKKLEDLQKARWYLNREIRNIEASEGKPELSLPSMRHLDREARMEVGL